MQFVVEKSVIISHAHLLPSHCHNYIFCLNCSTAINWTEENRKEQNNILSEHLNSSKLYSTVHFIASFSLPTNWQQTVTDEFCCSFLFDYFFFGLSTVFSYSLRSYNNLLKFFSHLPVISTNLLFRGDDYTTLFGYVNSSTLFGCQSICQLTIFYNFLRLFISSFLITQRFSMLDTRSSTPFLLFFQTWEICCWKFIRNVYHIISGLFLWPIWSSKVWMFLQASYLVYKTSPMDDVLCI